MDEPSSTETGAITLRIKFKTESLDDFVAKYGGDVSAGGIFIRTKQPLAVGTLLNFEFSLADSSLLMSGLGTVVWLREYDPARPSSVPGMGLRFDQLSPESQAMHQQLLAHKARREGKAAAAAGAAAATSKTGSGSNVALPRQTASAPVVSTAVTSSGPALSSDTMNALDEFDAGGKTEIANHPPSFFFEAAEKARAAAEAARTTARQVETSSPSMPMDDWNSDAQGLAQPEQPATANSLDLAWMHDDQGQPPSPDAPVAPMDDVVQTGEVPTSTRTSAADLPRAALLDLPMEDESSSLPDGGSFAEPVPTETMSLDSSAIEAIKGGPGASDDAAPMEAPDEKTDQIAVPVSDVPEQTGRGVLGIDNEAGVPPEIRDDKGPQLNSASAEVEAVAAGAGVLAERKRGGKGLVIVGFVAAAAAFVGVYLLHTKPWQSTPTAPVATSSATSATPSVPAPAPVPAAEPKPVEAKPAEPVQPIEAVPAKAVEAKVAEPEAKPAAVPAAVPAEEVKPTGAKAPAAEPKAEESADKPAKESPRAVASKKSSSKSSEGKGVEPAPAPVSVSDPAAPVDVKYILKVKSIPAGGDVLIDGERMGPTPFQRRILDFSKPHSVAIHKPGYEPYERQIGAGDDWIVKGADAVLTVTAKLTKIKVEEPAAPPAPAKLSPDDLHP